MEPADYYTKDGVLRTTKEVVFVENCTPRTYPRYKGSLVCVIRLMCLFICGWTGRLSILSTQGQDATTAAGPQNCPCCASRAAGIKGGCIGTVRGYPKPYTLTLNYYTRLQTRACFVVAECILELSNQVLCEACQGPAGWLWKKITELSRRPPVP